jgi:hypothetical protein
LKISPKKFGSLDLILYISSVIVWEFIPITLKPLKMNLLKLNSVGSVLDMEDGVVYPQLVGGLPDLNMGVELSECSDEWVLSLSREDRMKIKWPGVGDTLMNSTKFEDC